MVTFPSDFILTPLVPALILLTTAAFVILADLFLFDENTRHATAWIALIGLAIALGATLYIWATATLPMVALAGLAILDSFGLFLMLTIILITIIAVLMSAEYLREQKIEHAEFYALLLLAASGMMLMGISAELMTLWVGLETFSIALYVLAAYARPKAESEEAGLKYFFLGAFAAGFFLYGIAMTYGATGTTRLADIGRYIQAAGPGITANNLLFVAMGLILVGLLFKIAAVPFHQWTPDVYEGSPTAVTAFMATATKAAAFAALLRILFVAFPAPTTANAWSIMLAIVAVLTMIVGNVAALGQRNIKRMLAYSSITQAGYILIAVVAGGQAGITAALFYLLAYAVMTLGAFAVVIALNRGGAEFVDLDTYNGLAGRAPWLAFCMAIFMFALTGFPPFAGFIGKWYIFGTAVANGWGWLAAVGALASVVSAGYYLHVVVLMYMRPAPADAPPIGDARGPAGWAVGLTLAGTVLLAFVAGPMFNAAQTTILAMR